VRAKGLPRRLGTTLRTCAELLAIALAIAWMGSRAHAFSGTPKGQDASGHLSKARFILDNWPHVSWNYEWYSGQPSFAGSYPPGYHVLLALIAGVGNISLSTAMNLVTYGSVLFVVIGLYATVRAATGSRLGGLVAAGLLLGTPTLWSQMVVLGLYPRFAALAPMTLGLAAAISHARHGGRWRGLTVCVLLALTLSIHPVVGVIGVGLIAGAYLLNPASSVVARLVTTVAVLAGAFGLSAYFYLPLALSHRSQSAFTDTEVSLTWHMLFGHGPKSLDGLTPLLLVLAALLVGLAVYSLVPPEVPFAEKAALGTDVTFLSTLDEHSALPAAAGPATVRFAQWHRSAAAVAYPYRLAVLLMAGALAVFGYGLIGLVVSHFPYYVNGLQPSDLLVYPAFLLAGVVGLILPPALHRLAPGSRFVVPAVAAALCTAVIVPSIVGTAAALAPLEATNLVVAERASVLPAEVAGDYQYRFAGGADATSEWVNEYSPVPQVRGYDDHGALHLDWQVWLENTLLHKETPPAQRSFLFDWYAVKWVDADSGTGDLSQYDADSSSFTPLKSFTQPGLRIQTYRYKQASPILSATSAPAILVVGDDQHYDLFLRALALSGLPSSELIPVHGPTSLDDVTSQQLQAFHSVALYGASVGEPARDAAMLRTFVSGGGGLFVDATAAAADVADLAEQPASPIPVTASTTTLVPASGWIWTSHGDPLVDVPGLASFGAPEYATSGSWSTETAKTVQPWAHSVLDTHAKTAVVAGTLGQGQVVWEGLNLPYHLGVYSSTTEAAFFGRLLMSTIASPTAAAASPATVSLVDAEHWRITGATSGVLFKMQDAQDWQASANGHRLTIYPAGPGMMWIRLTTSGPVTVDLRYRISGLERLGYLISILSAAGLLALAVSGRLWLLVRRRIRLIVDDPAPVMLPRQRDPAASRDDKGYARRL
jgi:hypothetical protein